MRSAPRLERKKAFRVTHAQAKANRGERRPSFAARVFKLLFRRPPSALEDNRPKSWTGTGKPAPEATSEPLVRHASASVLVPSGASIRPESDLPRARGRQDEAGGDDECEASWRQRQTSCVNCGRLFFTSLSTLSCGSSRFCSLDCKTTFEYVNRLQEVLAGHVLGASDGSSGSSSEEEYDVETFDADQL